MWCSQCGTEISNDSKFCAKCGKSVYDQNQIAWIGEETKVKKNKNGLIGILAFLGGAIAVSIGFLTYYLSDDMRLERARKAGDKLMVEKQYDKAIEKYEKALVIDNKNVAVYEGIIDAYLEKEDYSRAQMEIERGMRRTGDYRIEQKQEIVQQKIKERQAEEAQIVFEKKIGEYKSIKGEKYNIYLHMGEEGYPQYGPGEEIENGLLGSKIDDFDQDGDDELLLFISQNSVVSNTNSFDQNEGSVRAEIYEYGENGLVLQDTHEGRPISTIANDSFGNWVTYKADQKIYIVEERFDAYSAISDGYIRYLWMATYDGESFDCVVEGDSDGGGCTEDENWIHTVDTVMTRMDVRNIDREETLWVPDIVSHASSSRLETVAKVSTKKVSSRHIDYYNDKNFRYKLSHNGPQVIAKGTIN